MKPNKKSDGKKSPNKKSNCYEGLRERILTLDIAPGSLLDETLLAKQYNLSRTPLREVFQRLSGAGYLALEENRGAKVSSMELSGMRQFFQSAPMIYSATARLAAENASRAQTDQLKDIQQSFRAALESGDTKRSAMFNHEFHLQIGEMAGNDYLLPSLNRLLIDHTRLGQMFYNPNNSVERRLIWKACEQHDAMIEAIQAHEPATAVALTLEHWELSRDRMEKFVLPDPLPLDVESEFDKAPDQKLKTSQNGKLKHAV